ncbi:Tumor susceptibility protein, partial [Ophiophagus hannah]
MEGEGSVCSSESGSRTTARAMTRNKAKASYSKKPLKAVEKYEKPHQKALEKQLERNLWEAEKNRQLASPAAAVPSLGALSATPRDLLVTNRGSDNLRALPWSPREAPEAFVTQAPGPVSSNAADSIFPVSMPTGLQAYQTKRPRLAPEATFTPTAAGLRAEEFLPQDIPPSMRFWMSEAIRHGIAAGVQQTCQMSGYSVYPYPAPSGPFPATTSTPHYPSQPPVTTVEKRALERSFGPQLGIRLEDAKLHWLGKSGMVWDQLVPILLHTRRRLTDPDILVIHLGGNDLGTASNLDVINRMKKDFGLLKQIFKNTILVWSNIIPRKVWNQEIPHKVMERSRKILNEEMGYFMQYIGGTVIQHDLLVPESPGLFHLDGVLLSQSGTDIFNLDLQSALETLI